MTVGGDGEPRPATRASDQAGVHQSSVLVECREGMVFWRAGIPSHLYNDLGNSRFPVSADRHRIRSAAEAYPL